jgi:carbon storage regulator CsrA
MLVLTRKPHESISIILPCGREVIAHICKVRGDKVSIGITAPKDVSVWRSEITRNGGPRHASQKHA